MAALKCPNPSCPFLFDPTQVPAGAVLTCPRCGMRFTLGNTTQTTAPPAPPPGSAESPPPASAEQPRRAARLPSTTDRGGPSLMTVVTVVGVVAAVVGGVVLLVRGLPGPAVARGDEMPFPEVNCAYRLPPEPWERDAVTMKEAGANVLGLKRSEPEVKAAVAASDFQTRMPQQGELTTGLEDRLKKLFDEPAIDAEEPGTWAGQSAVRVRFRGIPKGQQGPPAVYAGEGYGIAKQGVAYWFLGWAPEAGAADAAADFADLRDRFRLLDNRADWKPTTTSFALLSGKGADYRLQDGDRWWKEPPGADAKVDEDDPKADLLLRAEFKGQRKMDSPPKATLVTYLLSASDDPIAAVRAHSKAKFDRQYEKTSWEELTDPPQGDPPAGAGDPPAEPVRFRVDGRKLGRPMLVVVSAIALPGGKQIVGAEAYCPLADRGRWERRLVHLVGTLRPSK